MGPVRARRGRRRFGATIRFLLLFMVASSIESEINRFPRQFTNTFRSIEGIQEFDKGTNGEQKSPQVRKEDAFARATAQIKTEKNANLEEKDDSKARGSVLRTDWQSFSRHHLQRFARNAAARPRHQRSPASGQKQAQGGSHRLAQDREREAFNQVSNAPDRTSTRSGSTAHMVNASSPIRSACSSGTRQAGKADVDRLQHAPFSGKGTRGSHIAFEQDPEISDHSRTAQYPETMNIATRIPPNQEGEDHATTTPFVPATMPSLLEAGRTTWSVLDLPPISCSERCGEERKSCSCEKRCLVYKNCCEDFKTVCSALAAEGQRSFHQFLKSQVACSASTKALFISDCPSESSGASKSKTLEPSSRYARASDLPAESNHEEPVQSESHTNAHTQQSVEWAQDIRRKVKLSPDGHSGFNRNHDTAFETGSHRSDGPRGTKASGSLPESPPGEKSGSRQGLKMPMVDLQEQCSRGALLSHSEFYPVRDSVTGLDFANAFCAMCHGLDVTYLVKWRIDVDFYLRIFEQDDSEFTPVTYLNEVNAPETLTAQGETRHLRTYQSQVGTTVSMLQDPTAASSERNGSSSVERNTGNEQSPLGYSRIRAKGLRNERMVENRFSTDQGTDEDRVGKRTFGRSSSERKGKESKRVAQPSPRRSRLPDFQPSALLSQGAAMRHFDSPQQSTSPGQVQDIAGKGTSGPFVNTVRPRFTPSNSNEQGTEQRSGHPTPSSAYAVNQPSDALASLPLRGRRDRTSATSTRGSSEWSSLNLALREIVGGGKPTHHTQWVPPGNPSGARCISEAIASCPDVFEGSDVAEKCRERTSYMVDRNGTIYKNRFCMYCNCPGCDGGTWEYVPYRAPGPLKFSLLLRHEDKSGSQHRFSVSKAGGEEAWTRATCNATAGQGIVCAIDQCREHYELLNNVCRAAENKETLFVHFFLKLPRGQWSVDALLPCGRGLDFVFCQPPDFEAAESKDDADAAIPPVGTESTPVSKVQGSMLQRSSADSSVPLANPEVGGMDPWEKRKHEQFRRILRQREENIGRAIALSVFNNETAAHGKAKYPPSILSLSNPYKTWPYVHVVELVIPPTTNRVEMLAGILHYLQSDSALHEVFRSYKICGRVSMCVHLETPDSTIEVSCPEERTVVRYIHENATEQTLSQAGKRDSCNNDLPQRDEDVDAGTEDGPAPRKIATADKGKHKTTLESTGGSLNNTATSTGSVDLKLITWILPTVCIVAATA